MGLSSVPQKPDILTIGRGEVTCLRQESVTSQEPKREKKQRRRREVGIYVSCFDFIMAWQETCADLFVSSSRPLSLTIAAPMGEAAAAAASH